MKKIAYNSVLISSAKATCQNIGELDLQQCDPSTLVLRESWPDMKAVSRAQKIRSIGDLNTNMWRTSAINSQSHNFINQPTRNNQRNKQPVKQLNQPTN